MNENEEVGNTEHDPPPQESSFTHEQIREDISESVDEPKEPNCSSDVGHSARADNILESSLAAFDNWPDDFLEAILGKCESDDEPEGLNCSSDVASDVGHGARADNNQESSSLAFQNWQRNSSIKIRRHGAGTDFSVNPTYPQGTAPRRMQLRTRFNRETVPSDFKEEFVTVRAKAVNDNDDETEYIHKEEAICRVCNAYVLEEINLLRTKCKCDSTLLHEKCKLEWSTKEKNKICHICEELIHYIHVTLSRTSTQEIPQKPNSTQEIPQKTSFGKRFLKLISWFFWGKTG